MSWAAGWTTGSWPGPYVRAEIWVLNEAGIVAATGIDFAITWNTTPDSATFATAVYENVSQPGLTGAWAFGSASSSTLNPVTTFPMQAAAGDAVVIAAVAGTDGSYTAQNGYTLQLTTGLDSTATLGVADKFPATGFETGSMQHSAPDRQTIVGVVLQFAP